MKASVTIMAFFAYALSLGQEGGVITINSLDDAISFAMESNLNLTINQLQLEKAKMELKLAKGARMPEVNAAFMGQKNLELATTVLPEELVPPGETAVVQFGQEYQYTAGVTISNSLLDFTNRFSTKTKAKDVDIRNSDNSIFRESLISQISYAYYAAILSKEALQIAHDDLMVADSVLQLTQAKFDEGVLDLAALNRSKINFNNVKKSVDESTLVYEDSKNNLKESLGIDNSKVIEILEKTTLEAFVHQKPENLTENLEIIKNQQYKIRGKLYLKQARSEYLPKLSITSYFGSQLFQDEFDFSINDDGWAPVEYVALNINLPLFNGLSTRRQVKIAKIDAAVADLTYQYEKERLEGEDRLLLKNYELTASIAVSSQENYQLYREIANLEFSKYTEGLVALEVYLNAFEDYLNTKNTYLNALTTYYQYYAQVYARS